MDHAVSFVLALQLRMPAALAERRGTEAGDSSVDAPTAHASIVVDTVRPRDTIRVGSLVRLSMPGTRVSGRVLLLKPDTVYLDRTGHQPYAVAELSRIEVGQPKGHPMIGAAVGFLTGTAVYLARRRSWSPPEDCGIIINTCTVDKAAHDVRSFASFFLHVTAGTIGGTVAGLIVRTPRWRDAQFVAEVR